MNTQSSDMSPSTMKAVARYFHVLSDSTRLTILNELRAGPRNVGDLAQVCGFTAANISRHLSLLAQQGVVMRESKGNSVFYSIADDAVYALCDLVCGNIVNHLQRQNDAHRSLVDSMNERGE